MAVADRASGSVQFMAACRTAHAMAKVPDRPGVRVLGVKKMNHASDANRVDLEFAIENDPETSLGMIRRESFEFYDGNFDDLFAPPPRATKRLNVEEWLRGLVADGQVHDANWVKEEAQKLGYGKRTFERARSTLNKAGEIHVGPEGQGGPWKLKAGAEYGKEA